MATVELTVSPQTVTETVTVPAAEAGSPHRQAPRELRFGLVLYGGVSLAVYIYGVVLEFERLVRASCGVEENAWTAILKQAGVAASVDIVSGASAGGINGILLGKALATGARLETVRSIWTDKADISELLREESDREPVSLLRTNLFQELLDNGLREMDETAPPGDPEPLVSAFDLFIASTRLKPWPREFPTDLGGIVNTRDYRKSFELKLRRPGYIRERDEAGYKRNDFERGANGMLAQVARATSAFPVAFEPQLIERGPDNERFFLADEPHASYFSDGGILHNKPFTETISTIFTRAASRPVDRWLVSVEPDPELFSTPEEAEPEEVAEPNVAEVASKAVMGIPRYQSIAADLARLQEHRRQVKVTREKLAGIDEALLGEIEKRQRASGEAGDDALLDEWRDEVLAASDYFRERQRRLTRALRRRATALSSAEQWDEAAVLELEKAVDAAGQEAPDPDFEQRRIYHLLEMTKPLQAEAEVSDADRAGLAKAKLQLWGQFDRVEELLWKLFDADGDPPNGDPEARAAQAMERMRTELGDVERQVKEICEKLDRLSSHIREEEPGRFTKVFRWFELWDAQLLTIAEVSSAEARDQIHFARISPADTRYIDKSSEDKLAGDMLAHFSGFLRKRWRRNDLLWGRLDAAEVICRMIAGPVEGDVPAPLPEADISAVQMEIFAKEFDHLPDDYHGYRLPDEYRDYLERDYDVGKETLADLSPGERTDLALRTSGVVRNMLRGLGGAESLPEPLQRFFSWLGAGLGLLLTFVRRPARLWARLVEAVKDPKDET